MVGVTARDVMSREFVGVSEGDAVDEVLDLLVEQSADDALVLRGSEPVGVVSSRDLLEAVAEGHHDDGEPVDVVMSEPPAAVDAEDDLGTVLARLSGARADVLPVGDDDGELVGVVTDADVIAAATSLVSEPNGVDAADAVTAPEQTGTDVSGPATAPAATGATAQADPETSTQGLCESCGTLTADLQVVNGQSICPKCRDV